MHRIFPRGVAAVSLEVRSSSWLWQGLDRKEVAQRQAWARKGNTALKDRVFGRFSSGKPARWLVFFKAHTAGENKGQQQELELIQFSEIFELLASAAGRTA